MHFKSVVLCGAEKLFQQWVNVEGFSIFFSASRDLNANEFKFSSRKTLLVAFVIFG